jgi:radical SAM protein with 4Fe4S-binding SPASM domain
VFRNLWHHAVPLQFKHRLTETTLFVTTACNFHCRHCFVADELNKKVTPLSVDEIKRTAAHIPYMQRVQISGGEPFTRKDIADIALVLSNDWNAGVVCIPTNGWFTDNIVHTIEHFGEKAKGHLRVFFSINSIDEAEMDAFSQVKGSLTRWKKTVAEARKAADRFKNVTLVALSTYNEFNMASFPRLAEFVAHESEFDDFSFHLARGHDAYAPAVDYTNYRKVLDTYFRYDNHANRLLRAYRERVRQEHLEMLEQGVAVPCRAGTLRIVIAPNGDVYPCERQGFPNGPDKDNWKLGSLREQNYDLKAILATPQAKAVRERVAEHPCHCNHEIDVALSLLSRTGFRLRVLRDALALRPNVAH